MIQTQVALSFTWIIWCTFSCDASSYFWRKVIPFNSQYSFDSFVSFVSFDSSWVKDLVWLYWLSLSNFSATWKETLSLWLGWVEVINWCLFYHIFRWLSLIKMSLQSEILPLHDFCSYTCIFYTHSCSHSIHARPSFWGLYWDILN